jgi:hypothetical protein
MGSLRTLVVIYKVGVILLDPPSDKTTKMTLLCLSLGHLEILQGRLVRWRWKTRAWKAQNLCYLTIECPGGAKECAQGHQLASGRISAQCFFHNPESTSSNWLQPEGLLPSLTHRGCEPQAGCELGNGRQAE